MLLQNTLDLSTFEIVRFRIWNQTSNPNDYGIGTKYFNTNSGHEGYNRENIYTDTGWRRTAYMDDIEAITNGEGSLGTRVKTLEDMLNVDSAETVVSTWAEIQAFLDQVQEGTDLMELLNSKLDKTGGVMELDSSESFMIKRKTETGSTIIKFANNNGTLGYLGVDSAAPVYYNANGNKFTIIHTGNALDQLKGTFLPLTGGTITTKTVGSLKIKRDSNFAAAIGYENEVTLLGYIGIDGQSRPSYYDADTKQYFLLHSGNVGDYTAGAAKKLETPVLLWGNTFDGTQSLDGDIFMSSGKKVYLYSPEGKAIASLGISSDSKLFIGEGTNYSTNTIDTYLNGYNIYFRTGANQTAMTITEEGNVLVGAGTSHEDARLFSGGLTHVYGCSATPTLGSVPSAGLIVGSAGNGLAMWSTSGAGSFMQAEYFDDTSTALALNLNPLGGAVNVGGNLAPNANNSLLLGSSSFRWSDVYSVNGNFSNIVSVGSTIMGIKPADGTYVRWKIVNSEGGLYVQSGTYDGTSPNGTLNLTGINNEVLANLNVRATVSNFSNRVFIGGATDDGESALQVNNTMSIGASKTSYGLRFGRSFFTAWIPDDHPYAHNMPFQLKKGDTVLGSFGHYLANGEYIAYIGANFGNPWFTINSTESNFNVLTNFNGGALIPTGQTLTIGSVTFRETAEGEVEVDGNLHTTGTLASGGKAQEGEASTGGNAQVYQYELESGQSSYDVQNVKNNTNVIVQIYEWNSNTSSWDMILTDVSVKASGITVTFGRATTVRHLVTVC